MAAAWSVAAAPAIYLSVWDDVEIESLICDPPYVLNRYCFYRHIATPLPELANAALTVPRPDRVGAGAWGVRRR